MVLTVSLRIAPCSFIKFLCYDKIILFTINKKVKIGLICLFALFCWLLMPSRDLRKEYSDLYRAAISTTRDRSS